VLPEACLGKSNGGWILNESLRRDVSRTPATQPKPAARDPLLAARRAQALAFIRWFESRYVGDMQRVAGMSTDVADSIQRIGLEKTIARYVANRRAELDYAVAHRDPGTVPQFELDRIARGKYEGVIANVSTSGKWIDYGNKHVVAGIKRAYKQKARVWIPFYRRLLSAPGSAVDRDFRALIRRALTRREYEKTVEASLRATKVFYASLKKGVVWYAPWAPLIRRSLDSALAKDRAIWLATVPEIYDQGPTGGH